MGFKTMTLAAYQQAFARMVLSPALCRRVRDEGAAAFADSGMDAAELARLVHIARQPGMRITCMLARANRLSSLVGALPLTCELIKPELGPLLDRYWDTHPMSDLQSLTAGLAFAHFLADEIGAGRIVTRHAGDVLRYERAWLEMQLAVHTGEMASGALKAQRELEFGFDPVPLFDALSRGAPVPERLASAATTVVLDFSSDPPRTQTRRALEADRPGGAS
jgi:hypothetical protein